ncbi:MAG: sorbosone dehydrogenase family protein [Nitrospinaceae bacterium]|nr:sorbosone dehydrogenase family protein [Nitrospinaceae bacterium]
MISRYSILGVFFFALIVACSSLAAGQQLPLGDIKLPPGFRITVFARNVPNARSMALSPRGTLYVGTRRGGRVYAVQDFNRDGKADKVTILAENMNFPNGVAFRNGSLYVAEINRILRYDGIEDRLDNLPAPVVVNDRFPRDVHHGWKFIRFGPDGRLYVPVGAPCNVCGPPAPYASILRLSLNGKSWEVFARGIRNSVGFDWHPQTDELWFTDNGRDRLGDDLPPDELNHAPKKGMHFGFPFCHGKSILDPKWGQGRDCRKFAPPAVELGPHVASLGMRFYKGDMFPPRYRGQIFIAEHGSWNRSTPIGYRVRLVRLDNGRHVSYENFASGWLKKGKAWGRPVDIQLMPDGAMLVSDDFAGAIYRISY